MGAWVEYFGTLSSVVIVVSLMQKNIRWLRIINAIGAAAFATYGVLIQAWPVVALNAFITVIDIYFLVQMRNADELFDFLPVDGLQSKYVRKFIDFHRADIRSFLPEFDPEDRDGVNGCLILRDIRPVSIILYRVISEREVRILLDYSVPSHRDHRNARYFLKYVLRHLDLGHVTLTALGSEKLHRNYLEAIGFQQDGMEGNAPLYRLEPKN
ncbi:MAG: hypothetical protein MI717_07560 [Spirochaetales bacterium]|nr:hypothetical protein [Spirochaetales bacterium]